MVLGSNAVMGDEERGVNERPGHSIYENTIDAGKRIRVQTLPD